MADQVVDRLTVGIPLDFELTRDEVKRLRDETAEDRERVELDRSIATEAASRAQIAADEAEAWVRDQNLGITFAPTFDEPREKFDGMVWLKTDEESHTITNVYRWDADAVGNGLFPGASTYPGDATCPNTMGEFTEFKVAASALA